MVLKVCQNVEELLSQNKCKSFCFRQLQVCSDSSGDSFPNGRRTNPTERNGYPEIKKGSSGIWSDGC